MISIEAMIVKHHPRWVGHVVQMEGTRLPKQILFCQLNTGNRPHGRSLCRYKDQLKATLKGTNINSETWETTASLRSEWQKAVKMGVGIFENNRRTEAEARRQRRRDRLRQPHPAPTIQYEKCPRLFRAQIGLISHKRAFHLTRNLN